MPLIYFMGVAPGQLVVVAPVYVTSDDPAARAVTLEVGLPIADTTPAGLVSPPDVRAYAMRDVRIRLHQQRFRINVLHAYRERCAICALKERELVQAAHIVEDASPEGIAAVVNGIALCAIHHLAYDRNLLASIRQESCISRAGCSMRSTAQCSRLASRVSTANRSRFQGFLRVGLIRLASIALRPLCRGGIAPPLSGHVVLESGTYRFHAKELDASWPPDKFSSARSAPGVTRPAIEWSQRRSRNGRMRGISRCT